jgi:hypothetical protein
MNERIRELAEEAEMAANNGDHIDVKIMMARFAQLIVRECSVYCQGHILPKGMAEENDLNYNDGVMDCAIGLKQHFGVE